MSQSTRRDKVECPICSSVTTQAFANVDGFGYFQCSECHLIFIDPAVLKRIDAGDGLVEYSSDYWSREVISARERSFGSSLARLAEAMLYCRIPIKRVVDIGTGPGYFLDAVSLQLPEHSEVFYGVETYPPPSLYRTKHPNYIVGELSDLPFSIDLGLCVEVVEHLTPAMLRRLFADIAKKSTSGALYIFNTGLTPYVTKDLSYLDPTIRGHIVSYSVASLEKLANPLGFHVHALKGRDWAFVLEYDRPRTKEDLLDRVWTALPENKSLLESPKMGSALQVLGYETSRAYHYGSST